MSVLSIIYLQIILLNDASHSKEYFRGRFSDYKHSGEITEKCKDEINVALRGHFRPEFLNRIDEIVMFQRLDKSCIAGIVKIQLERVAKRLADRRIQLVFDDSSIEFLADKGYDPAFGARPIKRAIQTYLENPLSKELLQGKYLDGATIKISCPENSDRLLFN